MTLCKTLNFLQLEEIYLLELAKFMYQLFRNQLPQIFYASFCKPIKIHDHNMRNTKFLTYFIPCINKNFSKNLSYRGSKLRYHIDIELKSMQ